MRSDLITAVAGSLLCLWLQGCGKPEGKPPAGDVPATGLAAATPAAAAATSPLAEVEQLMRTNPATAVTRCRELLKVVSAERVRDGLTELLPKCLYAQFQALARKEQSAAAERVLHELLEAPADVAVAEAAWAYSNWVDMLRREYHRAVQAKDSVAAAAVCGRAVQFLPRRHSLRQLLGTMTPAQASAWRELHAAGKTEDAGRALALLADIAVASGASFDPVAREIGNVLDHDTQVRLARTAEQAQQLPTAVLLWHAAWRSARAVADMTASQHGLAESSRLLAGALLHPAAPETPADPAAAVAVLDPVNLDWVPPGQRAALTAALLEALMAAATAELRAGDYASADRDLQRAHMAARRLWQVRCDWPEFDVFAKAPPDLVEQVDDENPRSTPAERRMHLRNLLAETADAPLAEVMAVRAQLPELYARWGVAELRTRRTSGLDRLRPVLRQDPGAAAAALARDGVRKAFRQALAANDLDAMQDLAAFYVADARQPDGKDPFKSVLIGGLEAIAAASAKSDNKEREFFIRSLIADLFAGEPAGEQARQAAVGAGREMVRRTPLTEKPPTPPLIPSGVSGLSVLMLENGTHYHMLLFMEGVETFFVRINPLRRASVVIKDGTYTTGVLVTSDRNVRPYHGQVTYASSVTVDRYVIQGEGARPGQGVPFTDAAAASGLYTLVHTPAGVDVGPLRAVAEGRDLPGSGKTTIAVAAEEVMSANLQTAAQALRELKRQRKSEAAFAALRQAAAGHASDDLRRLAVEALVPFRRYFPVTEVWFDRLQNDRNVLVQEAAARAILLVMQPLTEELVAKLADHRAPGVREQLAKAAAAVPPVLDPAVAVTVLTRLAEQPGEPRVRRAALEGLSVLRAPYAAQVVMAGLGSTDKGASGEAKALLRHWYGDDRVLDALLATLADPARRGGRYDLLLRLGHWQTPKADAAMKRVLTGVPSTEQYAVLVGLEQRQADGVDRELRSLVAKVAAEPKQAADNRELALRALCQWQVEEGLEALGAALADKGLECRANIILWLGAWIADPKVRAILELHRQDAAIGAAVTAALDGPARGQSPAPDDPPPRRRRPGH